MNDDRDRRHVVRRIATFERLDTVAVHDHALDGTGLSGEAAQELANRTGQPVNVSVDEKPPRRRGTAPPGYQPQRPDDPFVTAAEFLCALCRRELDEALDLMAPQLVDELGGNKAAFASLGAVAVAPNFPKLSGSISAGGDDVEVQGDKAVVRLGIQNTREQYPELNRIHRIELDRSSGRWLVRTGPAELQARDLA